MIAPTLDILWPWFRSTARQRVLARRRPGFTRRRPWRAAPGLPDTLDPVRQARQILRLYGLGLIEAMLRRASARVR